MSDFFPSRAAASGVALALIAATAGAQDGDPSRRGGQPDSGMTRPVTPDEDAARGLAAGASSFLEGQAREAIRRKGYDHVSPLIADRFGIWRGTAEKGGVTYHVSVDYRGTVDAR